MMPNRRQLLEFGVLAPFLPALTFAGDLAAGVSPTTARGYPRLYKAIYDRRYAGALAFAAEMQNRGVNAEPIDGDITNVWFNDLALRWRESPVAIAGVTAPEALFCLEQLAWDHRMRVISRQPHAQQPLVAWVIAPVVRA
jgi:hypothetical protein